MRTGCRSPQRFHCLRYDFAGPGRPLAQVCDLRGVDFSQLVVLSMLWFDALEGCVYTFLSSKLSDVSDCEPRVRDRKYK